MRDPHVVSLWYELKENDEVTYDSPPTVRKDFAAFSVELNAGVLNVSMVDHYPTSKDARAAVEPVLRAWEIEAALDRGRNELEFRYVSSEVIDRDPLPGSLPALRAEGYGFVTAGAEVSLRVTRRSYPEPPANFAVAPDVETLWDRYNGYLEGKEPLLSMGYFSLTVLEALGGDRKGAAKLLQVDVKILGKLGELTSERTDDGTARKATRRGSASPLTPKERRWILAVLPKLIRQVGQHAAGHITAPLRMSDLPEL